MLWGVSLGKKIRAARQRRGWTQEELAARLGVGVTSIKNWESDKHEPKSALGRLEDELGVKLTEDTREPAVSESLDARLTGEIATRLAERAARIAQLEAEVRRLREENERLRKHGLQTVDLGEQWAARDREPATNGADDRHKDEVGADGGPTE
jgi:Predicted transcription factor, homolog of eukaryotic MBF1